MTDRVTNGQTVDEAIEPLVRFGKRKRISKLPDGVNGACGVYTKKDSDLFIDRDMTPKELRMIADHIESNTRCDSTPGKTTGS